MLCNYPPTKAKTESKLSWVCSQHTVTQSKSGKRVVLVDYLGPVDSPGNSVCFLFCATRSVKDIAPSTAKFRRDCIYQSTLNSVDNKGGKVRKSHLPL